MSGTTADLEYPPAGWPRLDDTLLTNLDVHVDREVERRVRAGGCFGFHAAWAFAGNVWYDADADEYVELVWRYRVPVGSARASTLDELMRLVNDRWGWG